MKSKKMALLSLLALGGLVVTGCTVQPNTPESGESESTSESTVIAVESVTLDKSSASMETGDKLTLTATITGADGQTPTDTSLVWSSSDENEEMATLKSTGNKCTVSAWNATPANTPIVITVASVADPSKTATCSITITKKDTDIHVESVTITSTDVTITSGAAEADLEDTYVQLNVTVLGPNGAQPTDDTVEWSIPTSEQTLATVSSAGLVKMLKGGTVHVTATSNDNPQKSDTLALTINDNYIPVAEVNVSLPQGKDATLKIGSSDDTSVQLSVEVLGPQGAQPTNPNVRWEVEQEEEYVSVSGSGKVTAIKAKSETESATATVKAISLDDETKIGSIVITIQPADIDYSKNPLTVTFANDLLQEDIIVLDLNESLTIDAIIDPNNGTGVEWECEGAPLDATFVKSSVNNLQAIFTAGTTEVTGEDNVVTITAKLIDTSRSEETGYVGEKTLKIQIKDSVTHVTKVELDETFFTQIPNNRGDAENKEVTLYQGDTYNLSDYVIVSPNDATDKTVSYISGDEEEKVITLDSKGKLRAIGNGSASVIIRSNSDQDVSETLTVNVKGPEVSRVELSESAATLEVGDTKQLSATVHFAKDDVEIDTTSNKVAWSVKEGDEEYIELVNNQPGLIRALKATATDQPATIIVTSTEDNSVKAEFKATVVDTKPVVEIINLPSNITSYKSKVQEDHLTSTTDLYKNSTASTGEFFEDSEENLMYKVGDQGVFKFKPTTTARLNDGSSIPFDAQYHYKLEKKNGDEWEELTTKGTLETYASIDSNEGLLEFTGDAVSNVFRLTVTVEDSSAYNKSKDVDTGKDATGEASLEFKVVEGYNAYSLSDLSFFDNVADKNNGGNWSTYRNAHPQTTSSVASVSNGIVMHEDVIINNADLEDESGWAEKMLWSVEDVDNYLGNVSSDSYSNLKTWKNTMGFATEDAAKEACYNTLHNDSALFYRSTHDTNEVSDSFVLEGNFFNIDYSGIKPVVFKDTNTTSAKLLTDFQSSEGSTAALFGINAKTDKSSTDWKNAENEEDVINFNNLSLNGNGSIARQSTTEVKLAKGSLIAMASGFAKTSCNNLINKSSFTAFQNETHLGKQYSYMNLEKVKAFDMYNGGAYIYGSEHNTISNSWFSQSGGPLFFLDEYNNATLPTVNLNKSKVEVENTYMMNLVAGNEPWFESHTNSNMLASAVSDTGDPTKATGFIGQFGANVYNKDPSSAKTTTRTMYSTTAGTTINVINLIAIDIYAGGMLADDMVFPQLSGEFIVKNGDETASLNPAETAKDANNKSILVNDEALMIAKSSKDAVVSANYTGGLNNSNLPYIPVTEFDGKTEEEIEAMYKAAAYNFATSMYMSFYLDAAYQINSGDKTSGYLALMLGTFDYGTYWA